MIALAPARLSMRELNPASESLGEFAARVGRSESEVAHLLLLCGNRLRRELALPNNPIEIDGATVTATGIAGLVSVAPGIEVEVAPKFLDIADGDWRTDFFVIASISRYGRVLDADVLAGPASMLGDLATLVGRTMVRLYQRNSRRPLRTYRRRSWTDFEVSGDVDAESLLTPSDSGFEQDAVALERNNPFNQVIGSAARALLPEVRDPGTRQQLLRLAASLPVAHPRSLRRSPMRVPTRHRVWQPLYSLSRQVSAGSGMDYDTSGLFAPGYALKMADAWQDFLSFALEADLGSASVRRLPTYDWGERAGKPVQVTPDIAIVDGDHTLLIDAKYKGRADDMDRAISATDAYEAAAFASAAGVDRIVLAYPRTAPRKRASLGATETFDVIEAGGITIMAVDVEVRGVSHSGGFASLSKALSANLRTAAHIAASTEATAPSP